MKKSTIIVIAVFVLIIGVFMITSQSAKSPEQSANVAVSAENTIIYTDNGFEPAQILVKAGTSLSVRNNSSKPLQFSSNDHPTHTKNSELNLGILAPGKSETFEASKTGTYGYHNHLNADNTGILTVE